MTDRRDGGGPLPAAALAAVIAAVSRLIGNEIALLKAEAARAAGDTRRALVFLAIAAILGLIGLQVLAGAAVEGLVAAGLHRAWSMVAVGGGLAVLALTYALAARRRLDGKSLAPWRSARSLRRDLAALGGEQERAGTDVHR